MLTGAKSALVRVEGVRVINGRREPFTAGLIIRDGKCVMAAPILRKFIGRGQIELSREFKQMGWRARILKERKT